VQGQLLLVLSYNIKWGVCMLQVGASIDFEEADGQVVTVSCLEGKPRNVFEKWDNAKWQLNRAWQQALQRAAGSTAGNGATSA
jgi:hypothetical protein